MIKMRDLVTLICGLLLVAGVCGIPNDMYTKQSVPEDPCYDKDRQPRACIPDFVNAAFDAPVLSSGTCGNYHTQRYCEFAPGSGRETERDMVCKSCNLLDPAGSFPSRLLTDLHNSNNVTCWRSEPIPANGSNNVTLTLSLGKKYELTYINLQLCPHAPRPESMVIYKSTDYGNTWQPFQYYSSQCRRMFGRPARLQMGKHNEHEARCSDPMHPGPGGQPSRIAFSTLDGRPSARDLDSSSVLQDWVTATDIKLVFLRVQRPNPQALLSLKAAYADLTSDSTFLPTGPSDNNIEVPAETAVSEGSLNGLHYAFSDFTVGGRCKCNGHGSKCSPDVNGQVNCECRHNTAGRDCERCKPFYFDRPWGRATAKDANECKVQLQQACPPVPLQHGNLPALPGRLRRSLSELSPLDYGPELSPVQGGILPRCHQAPDPSQGLQSLRVPSDRLIWKDLQQHQRSVPLQGRRHGTHLQPLCPRLSTESLPHCPLHQATA
nr:netrin-A isoform X3 [Drosophila bipectinata]